MYLNLLGLEPKNTPGVFIVIVNKRRVVHFQPQPSDKAILMN